MSVHRMRALGSQINDERGSALLLAGVVLVAALAMTALAMDGAMLYAAHADAQRAADAAALAGVSAFVDGTTDAVTDANTRAVETATQNPILNERITADEVHLVVDEETARVKVQIRRTTLPTAFARIFGVDEVTVSAEATAEAANATSASCVKPFAPPDPVAASSNNNGSANRNRNAYRSGEELTLKGEGHTTRAYAWVEPVDAGWTGPCSTHGAAHTPPAYEANICNCNRSTVSMNASYSQVAGSPGGLRPHTERGVEGLLAQDAGARWDATRGKVVGSRAANWRLSPRIVTVPLYDPDTGGSGLHFTRFIRVFLESESGGAVSGRFVNNLRVAHLVE